MIPSQEFIYTRTYSRWREEDKRREVYKESVNRYMYFMAESIGDAISPYYYNMVRNAIVKMEAMPSMRALWAAGDAAKECNTTMFNCTYRSISSIKAFSEIMYVLMCGAGAGFSVERQFVEQLPKLAIPPSKKQAGDTTVLVVIEDSRIGWARGFNKALTALWQGRELFVDYTKIRPRGSRLKTMGGRASGPEPLINLIEFCRKLFNRKRAMSQDRLSTLDCLDILNKIADIVVMGGVRRSSEISLSDLDDNAIAEAKMGAFWETNPHRAMSNNSAVYNGAPSSLDFLKEWITLMRSGVGERGIFNRKAALTQMAHSGRRIPWDGVGTNPCGEILLRDQEMCNLSEVVVRSTDTYEELRRKVKLATMIGVWQSTFTDFKYLNPTWAENCNEERLLGVSMTGIMDHPVLNNVNDTMKKWLADLKGEAIREAEAWAKRLAIPISAAITCVKPSGTVSQLVNSASGIHPRYAPHYIRRYRISSSDPLYLMMASQGVPFVPEVGQEKGTASTMVVDFPIQAPSGSVVAADVAALTQLEHWRVFKNFWCEHNPSVTVYVRDNEWLDVGAWVYKNFNDVCGISFLPFSNVYELPPYEEISETRYQHEAEKFPTVDYTQLSKFETDDNTSGAKELACAGGVCEV